MKLLRIIADWFKSLFRRTIYIPLERPKRLRVVEPKFKTDRRERNRHLGRISRSSRAYNYNHNRKKLKGIKTHLLGCNFSGENA